MYLKREKFVAPSDRTLQRTKGVAWVVLPFIVVLIFWQVLIWLELFPQYLFPSPKMVAEDFFEKVVLSQSLLLHIGQSLARLLVGYALGIAAGLVMGIAMGLSGFITRFFSPLLDFAHAIPGITWLPIAILWLGIGFKTIVFIVFLVVFFPVLYGTLSGMRTMSLKFSNVALMCGASKRQIIRFVLLPGSLPSIMNGIRVGAAYGWRGLIASEMIIASTGIGWLIIDARSWLRTETVVLGAFVIGILWICIDRFLLKTLEAKTIEKWGMLRK